MKHLLIAIVSALTFGSAASAAVIDITPYSRGCVDSNASFGCGDSGTASGNFYTGNTLGTVGLLRSFFLFDLSGVGGTIVSATLSFGLGNLGYNSTDASEGVGFFEISASSVGKLESSTQDASTYSDLGTGINLGYPSFTNAMENSTVTNVLTPLWLSALNGASGGKFGLGGSLITFGGNGEEGVFGGSTGQQVKLTITTRDSGVIPLPAGLPLLLSGLGGLALLRRSRRR